MEYTNRRIRGALGTALVAFTLGSCDFIETTSVDPNAVPEETATIDQLFTGIQVNTFFFNESQIARLASMWTQQMAGTDRQFSIHDQYIFTEDQVDGEFASLYTGGGLVDIRRARALAADAGCRACEGILKIHEAYVFGMGASVFGDIPYSQAADFDANPTPPLDEQAAVYTAVQTLLDEAIQDLEAGLGDAAGQAAFQTLSGADMNFAGDIDAWTAVAHTLKARFHLHWQETVSDDSRYEAALAAAANGIGTVEHNWRSVHTGASTENNLWYQFMRDRSGYISGGDHLIALMNGGTPTDFTDDDPRIGLYYSRVEVDTDGDGEADTPAYTGRSSALSGIGAGAPTYDQPIVSCAENRFIIAEAQAALGDDGAARAAVNAALDCQEAWWNSVQGEVAVDLQPVRDALAATADEDLFDFVMDQKYTALFLNMEVWNDYKRTCRPAITLTTDDATDIPGRLLYGASERQTNPNIPSPSEQPARNDNDPNACSPATP